MSILDFAEQFVDTRDFEDYMQDAHWTLDFKTHIAFELMLEAANSEGVQLTDTQSFDYDKFFWNVYQNSEKGLS